MTPDLARGSVIAVLGAGYWFLLTEPPENPWLAR